MNQDTPTKSSKTAQVVDFAQRRSAAGRNITPTKPNKPERVLTRSDVLSTDGEAA